MTLSEMLRGVTVTKMFQTMYGRMVVTHEVEIRGIQYDSRNVRPQDVFAAIRGAQADGHKFIGNAIASGAKAVVMEDDAALPDSYFMHAGVAKIVVPDTRRALALMAGNFFGHPDRKLLLVGITGTNGKTTTTHLVRSVLEAGGHRVGLIGTIGYSIGEEVLPATHTTPESLELNGLLSTMVERGCTAAVMEVSSHALALDRVFGLRFAVAGFTNLTQDHLDFHGSMEAYCGAKKVLFDRLEPGSFAVINADDPYGEKMLSDVKGMVLRYGVAGAADIRGNDVRLDLRGTQMQVARDREVTAVASPLVGMFNVYNSLAAFAVGVAAGVPVERIASGLAQVQAVRGRFERIPSPKGWTVVVDYAHTPDALEKCLRAIRGLLPGEGSGRIITVFGCGGNRDRGKRPIMGRIAGELSDIVVVTSDNPRHEDPDTIIKEILAGVVRSTNVKREPDRRQAIRAALESAVAGDVILIAGKGHETYQITGDVRTHFDDREEVLEYISTQS